MGVPKILIVDDSSITLQIFIKSLEGEHFEIHTTKEGAKGLKLASEVRPDLIILDYAMPEMNGLEFMHHLRDRKIETRVIVCSALSEIDFVVKCLRLGASDFVAKPFQSDSLIAKINRCLEVDKTVAFIDDPKSIILEISRQLDEKENEIVQLKSQIKGQQKLHLEADLKRKNHDLITKVIYVLIAVLTAAAFRFIGVETEVGLIGAFIVLIILLLIPMERVRKLTANVKTVKATMEIGDAKR